VLKSIRRLLSNKILRPLLLAVVILTVGLILFLPTLRVLRLQSRAGALLEDVRQTAAGEHLEQFWCLLPLLVGPVEDPRLAEAADLLAQAVEINPSHPHTYFLLGRARCLAGDFSEAITAFSAYYKARPDHPLGQMELAFAAYAGNTLLPDDPTPFLTIFREAIGQVAVTGEDFHHHADHAFRIDDYPSAWFWYGVGEQLEPLPDFRAFRKDLLDAVYTGVFSASLQAAVKVIPLSTEAPVTIPQAAFFRFSTGEPVQTRIENGQEAGGYYSTGDNSGVFISVPQTGTYCLTIQALDRPPAPTEIGITLDIQPAAIIELKEGNNTWKTVDIATEMESGVHLLGMALNNDAWINGVDRNAFIAHIIIQPCFTQ
jgi:hypothetical protein